jgi:pimeloyl-ACP methyl ester carboxylesterase
MLLNACTDRESSPVIGKATSKDGVSIVYEDQGKGDPALVFVHGWSCDRTYWDKQAPYFSRNYRVVTIDVAGHGESGTNRKAWTMKAFGEDVAAVVKKLGLEKVILMGHSMGGSVIVEAAPLLPGRVLGLVGVDSLGSARPAFSQEQIKQMTAPLRPDFRKGTHDFVTAVFFTPESDPELVKKIADDMSSAPPDIALAAMEGMFRHDLVAAVKAVQVPVHCINADKASFAASDQTGQYLVPPSNVKLMSKVGHFNMMEDPETFNRLLDETVKELVQLKRKDVE